MCICEKWHPYQSFGSLIFHWQDFQRCSGQSTFGWFCSHETGNKMAFYLDKVLHLHWSLPLWRIWIISAWIIFLFSILQYYRVGGNIFCIRFTHLSSSCQTGVFFKDCDQVVNALLSWRMMIIMTKMNNIVFQVCEGVIDGFGTLRPPPAII